MVVEILADGIADGLAPGVGTEGVDVFVLGKMDGLGESLGEIGEGAGGAGLNVAADDGGQETPEGGAEIAGGKVLAGEEIGQFAGEFIGGAGLGVFAGVVGAEVGMVGGTGSAALAAAGKGVKRHKDLRSLSSVAAERPTERREDIGGSRDLN